MDAAFAAEQVRSGPDFWWYLMGGLVATLSWLIKRNIKQQDDFKTEICERLEKREKEIFDLRVKMEILIDRDIPSKLEQLGKDMAVLLDRASQLRQGDHKRV